MALATQGIRLEVSSKHLPYVEVGGYHRMESRLTKAFWIYFDYITTLLRFSTYKNEEWSEDAIMQVINWK